jgi:hypothetical protein
MVRLDVHSLKDLLEAFPAPAVMRAGGHWMANQGASQMVAAGRASGEFQHFEDWLACQQPEQEGHLLHLMDKLSQNGIETAEATVLTARGEERIVEIRFLPGQGADMWLLVDQTAHHGELAALRQQMNDLEAPLNHKLEDLSNTVNLLLKTRAALKEERRLLNRIAEKLQVPLHQLEAWCKK